MAEQTIAFLGLGSNSGNRGENIDRAVELLRAEDSIEVLQVADLFESEPVGLIEQSDFFNTVAQVRTSLHADDLLAAVKDIESEMGRERTAEWGPRNIDIDILFFDDAIIVTPDLVVPHPLVCERIFALKPMVELAPDMVHPVFEKSLSSIFAEREKELSLYHCLEL